MSEHTTLAADVRFLSFLVLFHHLLFPKYIYDCMLSSNAVNVEIEIVLPADMTVRDSHDIGLVLQHKIERLSNVERAFVHVDHRRRDGLEHKIERRLVSGRLTK